MTNDDDHLTPTPEALQAWAHINSTPYMQVHGIPQAFIDYYHGTWPTLITYVQHQCPNEPPTPQETEQHLHTKLTPHYHLIKDRTGWHIFHKTN